MYIVYLLVIRYASNPTLSPSKQDSFEGNWMGLGGSGYSDILGDGLTLNAIFQLITKTYFRGVR